MKTRELFEMVTKDRNNYAEMIKFCCEDYILNNSIVEKYNEHYCDIEVFCGSDYDEEADQFAEVYQWYIINEQDAQRFAEYTNELVYFLPEFDMYVLAVTHFGTPWGGVSSNWKSLEQYIEENGEEF